MKNNTRKLLVSLYSPNGENPVRIKLSHTKVILPDLTGGGRRSLLHILKEKGLIVSERVLGKTSISLTPHGRQEIEAQFPALSSKWDAWQGSWDCLVFVKAPKTDKQFRYLRTLLVSEGAISISRGVYISPSSFSQKVIVECRELYRDSTLLFSVGEWKIADLRSLIIEKYGLLDTVETYSGISNDIKRLLISVATHNRLIDRHKIDINLVYDRLVSVLSEDPGFSKHYFNEIPNIKGMISDLNSLLARY
jgi:DNA-binding transcriptional regulator PaaX